MSLRLYQELLEDDEMWRPRDGNMLVEVTRDKVSGRYQVEQRSISEKDIQNWVKNDDARSTETEDIAGTVCLRLLICSARVLDQNIWPLSISSKTFVSIQKKWHLPPTFLRAICRQTPIASIFQNESANGLCLRTNLSWQWQYALAISKEADSNQASNAILLGLRATEITSFLSSLHNGLDDGAIEPHLLLPMLLIDLSIDAVARDAEVRRNALLRICHTTGTHAFHVDNIASSGDYGHNIRELARKLTTLSDACAGIKAVTATQERFMNTLHEFSELNEHQNGWCRDQLQFMNNMLEGVSSKMAYLTESCQGQLRVMYGLIAQEDGANHMRYIEQSSRIADHSQKIAEFTRRDSMDMRSISVLIMAFFPATFLATLFSSSFFNFQPREGDRVSRWIWLYCTICVILTSCSWAGWVLFCRLKNRQPGTTPPVHTWREEIDYTEKGKGAIAKTKEIQPPSRPYLSGNAAGMEFQDHDIEDIFQKEVPLGNGPSNMALRW